MTWIIETGYNRRRRADEGPIENLRMRLTELVAFFIIVFVAKEIAGFTYPSAPLLLLFLGAAVFQAGGLWLWAWLGRRRSWPSSRRNSVLLWHSSVVGLVTVLWIVRLTGGMGSPFLLLLAVPLLVVGVVTAEKRIVLLQFAGTLAAMAVLGLLEMLGTIPHYNCYPFDNEVYLEKHFYIGSLLVLAGFLSLIFFLANSIRHRFVDSARKLRQKEGEFQNKIQELSRLYDISLGINAVMTLETLLKMVAKEATLLLSRPSASIVLFNSNHEITHAVTIGVSEKNPTTIGANGRIGSLTEWMAENRKPVIVEDTRADRRVRGERFVETAGLRSLVGMPLNNGQRVIGAVYVGDLAPGGFEDDEVRLLSVICDQLVIAIAKSTLYESLRRTIENYEKKTGELEKTNQLMLEYVSHASHELRTPLTSIKAYVETISQHADDPHFDEKRTFLDIVTKETDRLIRVVNDILSVSNIEFGERPLERSSLSVREIVDHVVAALKPKLEEKKIRIETILPDDLPKIDADRDLAVQVFINLIANAVKYSSEGTTVRVRAKEEAVSVQITIEDEGIGIPASSLGRIFERYYRVKSARSRMDDGIGLGLAIVKNIIGRHGGTIRAESEENKGSKFIFTLPKAHCSNDPLGYLSDLISAKTDLHAMLNLIVRMIAELLSAKIISLMLLDQTRSELFIKVSYGLEEWIVEQARVKVGEGIAGKVAETGKPLLIDNIENNSVHSMPNNPQYETLSLLSAPLIVNGVVVGVINVNNKTSGRPFDQDDLNLLVSFGERISKALERLRTADDATMGLRDTVEALGKMVERQIETKVVERIVNFAVKTARRMGLNEKEVKVVQYVASVHDIGMTRVSDEILNKTFNLTPEEIKEIQAHPAAGNELMRPLEFVELVSNIILYHHERVDGLGYPVGLRGDHIPVGARILAVIDAYQSMTASRPYRDPLAAPEAVGELVACSGRQFDADVVDRFIDVLVDEGVLSKQQALDFRKTLHEIVAAHSYA
jgi:signal transduction histidine kinase/HD-GYP domain-containing protein (c-di-GMP phosphodiesterase class II)